MAKVKIYRDPNVLNVTVQYNHGQTQHKFDAKDTIFEVDEDYAVDLVRDCEDLRRTKVKKKVKGE